METISNRVLVCSRATRNTQAKTLASTNEVVNVGLSGKEKGEVRSLANGEGDISGEKNIGNTITDFFGSFARFHLD